MKAEEILFSIYSLLQIFIFGLLGSNIDIQNPIIYLDQTQYTKANPTNKSSYFGISVILFPGDGTHPPWVQIGAPRGNTPSLKAHNPGIIFRCPISEPCKYIEVDTEKEFQRKYNNRFDDAWIGATMDINLKYNRTAVCAPRWIYFYKDFIGNKDYRMLGACYWADLHSEKYHKVLPLLGPRDLYIYQPENHGGAAYNWGQGEAGVAVHLPENEKEMFIGAPGVFNWKGSSIVYRDKLVEDPTSYTLNAKDSALGNSQEAYRDIKIGNSRLTKQLQEFGLFGYAVTSGYFYSKDKLFYAGGAPRSKDYHGQVFIVRFKDKKHEELNVKESKDGTQFGEYFGAALAAGDINQDGYDDLFVGAPFRCNSKYNEGRMYLFLGSKEDSLQEPVRDKFIDGTYTNGQFGAAITYLGDFRRDGKRYVAVSAPYAEDGSGVVYIFKGFSEFFGIDTSPVQKIIGKKLIANIRGFGISISKPADIDANGYKDIAVGAYQSGLVILLRSRPLVIVTSVFKDIPTSITKDRQEFSVKLCHTFTSHGGIQSINLKRKVKVDENFGRAEFLRLNDDEILRVRKDESRCEELKIKLRGHLRNQFDSLTLAATHYFLEDEIIPSRLIISNSRQGRDRFCNQCGVYDSSRSRQPDEARIPFALDCGSDNVCMSDLIFNSSFNIFGKRTDTFILGSTNIIYLETDVRNKGENAYLVNLQVDLPKELSLKKIPTLCQQNETRIICPLANVLGKDKKENQSLKLDMAYVNKKTFDHFLYINVTVLTNSVYNRTLERVKLNLKTEADITISGKSDEQSYVYGNESDSKIKFQQTYLIGKFGLSPVSSIGFQILVPYAIKSGTQNITFMSLYQPEGRFKGQSITLHSQLPILDDYKFDSTEIIVLNKMKEVRKKRSIPNSGMNGAINTTEMEKKTSILEDQTGGSNTLGRTTYEINCDSKEVLCGMVYGSTGPFEGSKDSAVLQLRFLFDVKNLTGIIQKNSVIKYSTTGKVEIKHPSDLKQSGIRPDTAIVSSIFLKTDKKKIDLWIIIVSVVFGLLILLFVTLGLTKAGFFKRAKKEELEQLKAAYNEEVSMGAEASDSDLPNTE